MDTKATIVIFTDLDGTLLHPETYSFEAARPALELVERLNIPLVLCSSKTRAELELYRQRLNNLHPYISENGGGIFAPGGYFSSVPLAETGGDRVVAAMGLPYHRIRQEFVDLRNQVGIPARGFGDMTVAEVSAVTGLPREEAILARRRDFSEPFTLPDGTGPEAFLEAAEARGLRWTRGKFYCLMGEHDKGKSVRLLIKAYEEEHGKIISIGLGDALNDLPLLNEVDLPVLIRRKDGTYDSDVRVEKLVLADGVGPEGWNKVILSLLEQNRPQHTEFGRQK